MFEVQASITVDCTAFRAHDRVLIGPVADDGRTVVPLTQKKHRISLAGFELLELLVLLFLLGSETLEVRTVLGQRHITRLLETSDGLPGLNAILEVSFGAGYTVDVLTFGDGLELVQATLYAAELTCPRSRTLAQSCLAPGN